MRLYEVFESHCHPLTCMNDICPFPTALTLANVTLTPRSFLVFPVFRPFLERLSCFSQDGHIRWRWQWFTERSMRHYTYCVAIYYKKDVRAGMPSFGKKSSEPRFQGKWTRWKLWKKLSGVFTSHILNMGMNNIFLSMIRGQKKTKR